MEMEWETSGSTSSEPSWHMHSAHTDTTKHNASSRSRASIKHTKHNDNNYVYDFIIDFKWTENIKNKAQIASAQMRIRITFQSKSDLLSTKCNVDGDRHSKRHLMLLWIYFTLFTHEHAKKQYKHFVWNNRLFLGTG